MEKCPILKEYGQLMAIIQDNKGRGVADPYKEAVQACIKQGILKEYLQIKGSEVCNMLTADYNYELDIQVQREEAAEEAREELHKSIVQRVYSNGKSIREIADFLGEPVEEIEKIVKECKACRE